MLPKRLRRSSFRNGGNSRECAQEVCAESGKKEWPVRSYADERSVIC